MSTTTADATPSNPPFTVEPPRAPRRTATRKPAKPAATPKPKPAGTPAKPSASSAPKPAPKPERAGLPVKPDRRKITAGDAVAPFAVVEAIESPWHEPGKPGAQRLVIGLRCKIGSTVDLSHAKSAKWLGTYLAVKPVDGQKYSVWDLVAEAAK